MFEWSALFNVILQKKNNTVAFLISYGQKKSWIYQFIVLFSKPTPKAFILQYTTTHVRTSTHSGTPSIPGSPSTRSGIMLGNSVHALTVCRIVLPMLPAIRFLLKIFIKSPPIFNITLKQVWVTDRASFMHLNPCSALYHRQNKHFSFSFNSLQLMIKTGSC